MMKLKVCGVILAFALTLGVAGCGGKASDPAKAPESPAKVQSSSTDTAPAKPAEIVIGHVTKTTDNFHVSAEKFKEYVESHSKGQVTVRIEPEAKLGPEKDLLTKVQSGELDAAISTNGSFATFVPEFGLFDLPFLFENIDHVHKALDGKVGAGLAEKSRQVGFEPLGLLDFGFRHLTNSKRPVKSPADTEGLKIRVIPNAVYQATWEAATKTKPVSMNWTDVAEALKSGKIDGQENPVSVLVAYKMWETQKYVSKTGHVFAIGVFVMSPAKFKSLTPDQQKIVQEGARVAVDESRRFTAEAEEKGWQTLKQNGMVVTEDVDLAAFRKVTLDAIYDRFGKTIPAEWVQEVRNSAKQK